MALRKKQVQMKFQSVIARVVDSKGEEQLPQIAQVGTAIRKRREACESLRMLVFGRVGNEQSLAIKDKNNIFEQKRGTREELRMLHKLWLQLDTDSSGDVDMQEFTNFFNRNKEQRLLGWKAQQFLGKTGRAKVEDFLKLLYLEAEETDLAEMKTRFDEEAMFLKAVKEPPVIPAKVRKELMENFRHLDKARNGHVTFEALVKENILTTAEAHELMAKYDTNNDGKIDENEFLEMLCPHGFRASENAAFATDSDGAPIMKVRSRRFQGWIETDKHNL
jgi:Ca2+-binding EF-hand superfamily protein